MTQCIKNSRRNALTFFSLAVMTAFASFVSSAPAQAQDEVTRIIVPYKGGGPIDITTRILAEAMKESLGTIVVESKPGGGANIGMKYVADSKPDGYTLGIASTPTHGVNVWLYSRMPFDPDNDFTPISQMVKVPNVLVMKKETAERLHIKTVGDLIEYGKKNLGKLNYGSGGNGSGGHLAGALFDVRTGIKAMHIPFNGSNPAEVALLGGQVDFSFDNLATAAANIKAGLTVPLAVTTLDRSGFLPDVPTMDSVLPGFEIYTWWGVVGPAGLSGDSVMKLNKAVMSALHSTAVKTKFASIFAEPIASSPEDFRKFMASERSKYKEIVKLSGARAD